jgi:hypothetical protein
MAEFNLTPSKDIEKNIPRVESSVVDLPPSPPETKVVQPLTEDTLEADKKAFEDLSKSMPIEVLQQIQIAEESQKNSILEDWFKKKNLEKK